MIMDRILRVEQRWGVRISLRIILALYIVFSFAQCSRQAKEQSLLPRILLQAPNGSTIYLEIADTKLTRQYGLMYRETLAEDEGMLFVFPEQRIVSFWMKNTPIDLNIAYIDKEGIVKKTATMHAYSTKSVSSDYPVRYAIEMNKHAFDALGIRNGVQIKIPSTVVAKE